MYAKIDYFIELMRLFTSKGMLTVDLNSKYYLLIIQIKLLDKIYIPGQDIETKHSWTS